MHSASLTAADNFVAIQAKSFRTSPDEALTSGLFSDLNNASVNLRLQGEEKSLAVSHKQRVESTKK